MKATRAEGLLVGFHAACCGPLLAYALIQDSGGTLDN
jgi:hypothetical protein